MKVNKPITNVILHIGLPKTSTTSVQDTLFSNKLPPKYYYPKSWFACHGWVLKRMGIDDSYIDNSNINLNPVVNTLSTERIRALRKRDKKMLANELYKREVDTLLFSAEHLYNCSEETLFNIKKLMYEICNTDKVHIKVVAYVRNPISFLTSSFQEVTRNLLYYTYSDLNGFSDVISCQNMQLQKFSNVFGKENLKLFKFEEAVKHQHGPVGFFYDAVLNIEPHEIRQLNIKKSNESMSQIAADICSFINAKVPMFNQDRSAFSGSRKLFDLFLITKTITGERFKLDKKTRFAHLDKVKEQVLYLKNNFGIEYSIDQMKLDIEMDKAPNHIPTLKNMEEISRIFYRLDTIIQAGVIDYIQAASCLYPESDYLIRYVDKLEKKRKNIFNKRSHVCRKIIREIKSEWFFLPTRIIWLRHRLRKVVFRLISVFEVAE